MDTARCRCLVTGGRHPECPFHGDASPTPIKPYVLTVTDRKMLKEMRIAITDAEAIEQVRKADEDRFRRD